MAKAQGKRPNTAAVCEALAAPVAQRMGLYLWDVAFEKEGAGWYLRYYIDREGGVTIDECEAFSREVSDLLDEADPIDQSYTLEVGSRSGAKAHKGLAFSKIYRRSGACAPDPAGRGRARFCRRAFVV